MLVLLLLLIPVFCMGVSVYVSMLYSFVNGQLYIVPLLLSILAIVVLGYFLPRIFYKLYKSDTAGSLNAEAKVNILSNYISYIVLLAFGIALLIKCIINKDNIVEIYLAGGIVFLFIYITYVYYFCYKNREWEIVDIVEKNKDTNIAMIENKEYGLKEIYVNSKDKYKIGNKYKFKYNPNSNVFKIGKFKEEEKDNEKESK